MLLLQQLCFLEEKMRLRNVKGSREAIAANEYVVQDEKSMKGKWKEKFGNNNPIYIEIGMGKGRFIMDMARLNPDINFVGIEKFSSVLVRALEKQQEEQLPNLYFIRMEAEYIEEVFDKGEVNYVFLNFSDPWPKDRHAKRRLTSTQFLKRYENILSEEGGLTFKTDNRLLFDFSLEQVREAGWILDNYTFDLHNSQYVKGNVMTEYEERFSSMGNPICRLVCRPQRKN